MKNKLLILIACILLVNVNASTQGILENCSQDKTSCQGCGSTTDIQNLFSFSNGQCRVTDCSKITGKLNGFVCHSCAWANESYTSRYFDGTKCVDDCPQGQYASFYTGYQCKDQNLGNGVECFRQPFCDQCSKQALVSSELFQKKDDTCLFLDCSVEVAGPILNGWICNSCKNASGSGLIPSGQFYDGNTCVDECPVGTSASAKTNMVCLGAPDASNIGSAVNCSSDSATCQGCAIYPLKNDPFSYQSGNSCFVKDCRQDVLDPQIYSGWICQSCSTVSGTGNIVGKYLDMQQAKCVDSCPDGKWAILSNQFICLDQSTPVACSKDSSTCKGCGETEAIQNLFTYKSDNKCQANECRISKLNNSLKNGWLCNSCKNQRNIEQIVQGSYFFNGDCVDQCPYGQYANEKTGFNCQPFNRGSFVDCTTENEDCGKCGTQDQIDQFEFYDLKQCRVNDCSADVIGSTKLNGWLCKSCSTTTQTGNIPKGQFFDGKTCVASCPTGQVADLSTGYTCQAPPSPGSDVPCSQDSSTCAGCGQTNAIQQLFAKSKGQNCSVKNCDSSIVGSNLNGWICNSCKTAKGQNDIARGQYYDGTTCVDQCPEGQAASVATGYVCKRDPTPGQSVQCSNDSSTCGGCGSTVNVQNLFTHSKGNSCYITDCYKKIVGNNLNGWVCNSCSTATGDFTIPVGQYYDGSSCVTSCPKDQIANADTGFVCKQNTTPGSGSGNDVECSSNSSTCEGCGSTKDIQALFTHKEGKNCSIIDCGQKVIGSNLNGWVCNSCSKASGEGNIVAGQYFDGKACVSSCPSGQSASATTEYLCKSSSNPPSTNIDATYSNLIGYLLIFAILNILI